MLLAMTYSTLKRKKYMATAVIAALILFGLSYYLMVFNINGKSMATYAYMNGVWYTVVSVTFTIISSVLFGIYAAVWLLKRNIINERKKSVRSLMGAGGAFGGVLAAGCPTCGAPLLALLGAPLALMSLPFKGLEIKLMSIILLFLSIYWLAENIRRQISGVCRAKPPQPFSLT